MKNDQRKYDKGLVDAIRHKERVEEIDGVPTVLKPIPDRDEDHVLDPRVKETIARKAAMFAQREKETHGSYSLANERFRPDKVTYDLTEGEIIQTERLIEVNGTHKIDLFTYRAQATKVSAPAIVFLHGGGFTAGNERIYHNQMRFLAEKSGAVVAFPEYRLAPESPFPAAIEDCVAAVRWVHDNAAELGVDPERMMVAGDSAGGTLANSCVLEDEAGMIKRSYLIFPSCDNSDYTRQRLYRWSFDSYPVDEAERELTYGRIDRIRKPSEGATAESSEYVQGKTSLEDPLVSVVYATDDQLRAFPPITVAVSEYDYLRLGAEYFAKRLYGLGKDVRLVRYCGCDHGFLDLFGTEPQAEEVCLDMSDEVKKM